MIVFSRILSEHSDSLPGFDLASRDLTFSAKSSEQNMVMVSYVFFACLRFRSHLLMNSVNDAVSWCFTGWKAVSDGRTTLLCIINCSNSLTEGKMRAYSAKRGDFGCPAFSYGDGSFC